MTKSKKGFVQKISRGAARGSSVFPYIKRTRSSTPAASAQGKEQQKKQQTQQTQNKHKKSQQKQYKLVSSAVLKPAQEKPKKINWRAFHSKPKPKSKSQTEAERIIMSIRKFIFILLCVSTLLSVIFSGVYIYDYVKGNNTEKEKNLLKTLISYAVVSLIINIILVIAVNSYWKIVDFRSFSFVPTVGVKFGFLKR